MSNVETFSTIVKDGEELTKINTWLNRFRCDELFRFQAKRVTEDSTKIILEAQDSQRLRIVSSWPPHQAYLATTKTVPYIDVLFSEPIALDTFKSSQTKINGVAVADIRLSTLDNDYTLRIDTTGFALTTAGQYELIFGTEVRHYNKIWKLYGERKVIWSTSEHGGSRGGEDIVDPEKNILSIAKISVEGQHDEQKMIREFYNKYKVDPDDVEQMILDSGYPEHNRTTIWVIYCTKGIPYVKCTNPEYKVCMYQDGAPSALKVEIGFTEEIEEDSLEDEITVDGVVVGGANWDLTQGGKLLSITFTPAQYKHHIVKIASMKSGSFIRTWPFAYSFVVHKLTAVVPPTKDDLDVPFIDTIILTNSGSPYTLVAVDAGKYYRVDTSGGSVVVNLPASGVLVDGAVFGFIKTSASNTLTINRNGSDLINGLTSLAYTAINAACILENDGSTAWSVAAESSASTLPTKTTIDTAYPLSVLWGGSTVGIGTVGIQQVYTFDSGLAEYWEMPFMIPAEALVTGTLKAAIYWSSPDTAGDVKFTIAISRRAAGDNMATPGYDTANPMVATVNGTTERLTITSIDLTNKDSIVAGDFFILRLTRMGADGADTAASDASVYALKIWYER